MKLVRTKQVAKINGRTAKSEYRHAPLDKMEAIADGVQARLEESTSFSRKVTDETVNTARALGVADAIIERWVNQRLNLLAREAERLREIRSILHRVRWDSSSATLS
jgi:ABC-type ATPase with predicted acetyltransferase domain